MNKYILTTVLATSFVTNVVAQQITITGTVTDKAGEPLIGANVTIKDAPGMGVVTDMDGKYRIKVEPYRKLVFSYIGFKSQEVTVKDKHVINIKLLDDEASSLDEVVVTGMGTQKKITVTGAVTNVNVGDLKHYSSSNISNMLAGNVAGVLAMQSSGQPGKNTSEFWIRGISTFGASSSAYIIVDGFERSNLDDINIEDIESFTVLKDASATAIYGSKGANGVVLITTKHGKAGKVNISAKVESSYNMRTITPQFEDGITYANLINEANVTRNRGVVYQPEELDIIRNGLDPDLYPNVDWSDLLLKNGAWSYRANLNINGGGSTARYFLSGSYTEDQGMYKTDDTLKKDYNTNANYKRWNYRMNVDIDVTRTTLLKVGVSGSLAKRNSPGGNVDVWGELFGYTPLLSPVVYSNGYIPMTGGRTDSRMNPWVGATQTGYDESWENKIQTNVTLEQNLDFITEGLRFTGRFGYDTNNSSWISHRRWPAMYKANGRDSSGEIIWDKMRDAQDMQQSSGGSGDRREFLEAYLSWERAFKEHHLGATLKYNQDSKKQTYDLGSDIKNSIARRNMGLAGRATYNYALRYFVDFNFGYNGSENFATGHQFGFFPAYSVAWNLGGEKFVTKAMPWINMFKIRYSHGKVGNDNMGTRFPFLYSISGGAAGYNFGTNTRPNSFAGTHYTQVASPNVTWEIATKNDIGIDMTLFKERFSLTVDYFNEKRTGIYMVRNYLPDITGLESKPSANVGAVRSRGFDGNFSFRERIGQVDFTMRGNITYSKNEILEKDEENKVYSYQYERGYRVDQERGLIALGLFKDYDDIRTSPKQNFGTYQPGDIKYADVNGDGVVDDGDRVAIGATRRPNLIYGLGFSAAWKGFDVNLHFQGAGKSTFPIYGKCVHAFKSEKWGNIIKGMLDNRYVDAETAAKLGIKANEDPNASYPRLSYGGNNNNQQSSTFWLRDGRYLRLKNVDVGYTLPKSLVTKAHLSNLRIFVTGSNLITWSKFKYWDPESTQPQGEEYPLTKSVTFGLNIEL